MNYHHRTSLSPDIIDSINIAQKHSVIVAWNVTVSCALRKTFCQKIINLVNEPVTIGELKLQVGCSIGISLYPSDSDQPEVLLRYSDIAMYAAKASGRNGYYFFDSKLQLTT